MQRCLVAGLLALCLLALTACAARQTPTPTPTAIPTATSLPPTDTPPPPATPAFFPHTISLPSSPSLGPLLNNHTLRIINQVDTYDVNHPTDENANGLDEADDNFGARLVAADFDQDGYDDLAMSAPGEAPAGGPASGAVHLLEGSGGGPSMGEYRTLTQADAKQPANPAEGDQFGLALAAGDIDGDKFPDLVVGAPGKTISSTVQAGAFFVFRSSSWRPFGGLLYTAQNAGASNQPGDRFGSAVAVADFNHDGFADVAAAAPGDDQSPHPGSVYVFPGSAAWLTPGRMLPPPALNDDAAFGATLAAGDFDGDGFPDLAVGAPNQTVADASQSGAVYMFAGTKDGLNGQAKPLKTPLAPTAHLGRALAVGDFDGDGNSDLAVGAPGAGIVYIFRGSPNGLQPLAAIPAPSPQNQPRFGEALAAGDLDHDGKDDLVIGSPSQGRVFVLAGAADGFGAGNLLDPTLWEHTPADDAFGAACAVGDFHGTGAADLAIGAPGQSVAGQFRSGVVYLAAGLPRIPVITHGPLVGAVTDSTATIWARADHAAELQVKYKPLDATEWTTTKSIHLKLDTDFTGVITLANLQPDASYAYLLVLDGIDQAATAAGFKTFPAPNQPTAYRFGFGSCIYYPQQPFTIFDRAAEANPAFIMLMGDQIYADGPDAVADTQAGYERKYKENFADPSLAAFMRRFPTFMIWDDHEIENDWDNGKTGRYFNGKLAYDEYQGSHNPPTLIPGENYYTFSVGDTDFFVLDARTFRSNNGVPEGPDKTMLGARQKALLKKWLSASQAKFKFIVSSTPFHQFGNTGSNEYGPDNWQNFQSERAEIFAYIRDNCIPGVVLLSADNHWSGAFRLPYAQPIQLYEFMPNPLGVPLRPMTEATDPQILFKDNTKLVYGLVAVDTTTQPPHLRIDYIDTEGNSIYNLELTTDDILPSGACTPRPPS